MCTFFLGFLKIDLAEIIYLKNNKSRLLILIFFYLIVLPLLFFAVSGALNQEIRIGLFLIFASSAAMAAPILATIYRLNVLWSAAFAILTSLLVPFTIPFLVKICFKLNIEINTLEMILFLSKIILIPVISAFLTKKYLKKPVEKLKKISGFAGTITMALFIAILVAKNNMIIKENIYSIFTLQAILFLCAAFLALFIIGYFIPAENIKERLLNMLTFGIMNNGIVILLSDKFFSPVVFWVVLLTEIPLIFSQLVFGHFVHCKLKKEPWKNEMY